MPEKPNYQKLAAELSRNTRTIEYDCSTDAPRRKLKLSDEL